MTLGENANALLLGIFKTEDAFEVQDLNF